MSPPASVKAGHSGTNLSNSNRCLTAWVGELLFLKVSPDPVSNHEINFTANQAEAADLSQAMSPLRRASAVNVPRRRPEQVKAEDLLRNMFPNVEHVRALVKGRRVVDHLEDVTIMFSDLKGYTQWASEESPKEVYRVLNKVRQGGFQHSATFVGDTFDAASTAFSDQ